MAIKLNSVNTDIFDYNASEFKQNGQEWAKIVTCGRMLMMESAGRDNNALRVLENREADYKPMLTESVGPKSYATVNRNLQHKMMLFAAKKACDAIGKSAPENYEAFLRDQRGFMTDSIFLKVLSGLMTDIVAPLLPVTMSNALGWLAETVTVPVGKTYELDIQSNDVFIFEDDSWGASRSKPSNYLYNVPVTLNPTPYTAKATVKWYQLVGNNADLGRVFNSFAAGLYSKVCALAMGAMTTAASNTTYVPSNLLFTNSTANWVTAASRVAMVNGTRYRNVIGIGHPSALAKVLPSGNQNGASVNLDAALSTMLGVEWARYGYIGEYMGVRLMPIDDAIVPGTQNTTITGIVPNDKIYLLPIGGYRPIYVGMEEGNPITIQLDPRETADMTIDIMVTAAMDVKPVFASKIAIITA